MFAFKRVDSEEWANFTSDYRTIQNETLFNNFSMMNSKISSFDKNNGVLIAYVKYFKAFASHKEYYILVNDKNIQDSKIKLKGI